LRCGLGLVLTAGNTSPMDSWTSEPLRYCVAPIMRLTELVEAGLWHEAEGGYEFHDWHKYQDTRAEVERRRESWKERQRKHRGQSEEKENHSSLLEEPSPIPFHSTQARDSRRDTQRESQRDAGKDDPNFQAFWALYPRKEGKGAARTAYRKACRNVPPEVIGGRSAIRERPQPGCRLHRARVDVAEPRALG
jgi:hypothetical protein